MKIKAQIAMVLNLDKCIGCHTCSVTCKNVWTSRKGLEYAWFNNVETKPGYGYPVTWEDQDRYKGGWIMKGGKMQLRQGKASKIMSNIFSNPYLPEVNDYYEPFTMDYSALNSEKRTKTPPSTQPYSLITGDKMKKIEHGPNWEEDLGGEFNTRKKDPDLKGMDTTGFDEFERSFMFYVPRLCEHCLHPACVAACPSGAIYKRKEDGIVLINQTKCRGWRQCISACPYKKIYFNDKRHKSEKCVFCYPRIESGEPTVCSESCVGRMRYLGVILYNADKINEYASADTKELYGKQLAMILNPNDDAVIREAEAQGIPHTWTEAAKHSPAYKMMKEWQIAFPLHPEYRTLPMVWYIPPMSPVKNDDSEQMRIPEEYIARLLTAGDVEPINRAFAKMKALRRFMRQVDVDDNCSPDVPEELELTAEQYREMYRYLAIARYDDRFVIPSSAVTRDEDKPFSCRVGLGFKEKENDNLFGGR
jgi:nitrate reductase / nitrite oxidoreductase, beta subunit